MNTITGKRGQRQRKRARMRQAHSDLALRERFASPTVAMAASASGKAGKQNKGRGGRIPVSDLPSLRGGSKAGRKEGLLPTEYRIMDGAIAVAGRADAPHGEGDNRGPGKVVSLSGAAKRERVSYKRFVRSCLPPCPANVLVTPGRTAYKLYGGKKASL